MRQAGVMCSWQQQRQQQRGRRRTRNTSSSLRRGSGGGGSSSNRSDGGRHQKTQQGMWAPRASHPQASQPARACPLPAAAAAVPAESACPLRRQAISRCRLVGAGGGDGRSGCARSNDAGESFVLVLLHARRALQGASLPRAASFGPHCNKPMGRGVVVLEAPRGAV